MSRSRFAALLLVILVGCASASTQTPGSSRPTECDNVEGVECGDASELAGMTRFCVAIDEHKQQIKLTRDIAGILNKAALPGVTFTAKGLICPPDTEGLIFYNARRSYGTVSKLMPNGNIRLLINHMGGGINLKDFIVEFINAWSTVNGL